MNAHWRSLNPPIIARDGICWARQVHAHVQHSLVPLENIQTIHTLAVRVVAAVTGALATGGRVGHNTRPFVRTATPAVRLVMEAAAVTAAPVILEIIFMMAGRAISAMIVHAILIVVRASTVTSPLPALTHAVRVTQAVIGVMEVVITIAPSVSQEIICTMAGRAISALSVRINGRMAGIARQESTATTKMRFQMRILSMIVTRVTQAVIDVMEAALAIAPSVNQEIICTTA